MGRRKIEIKAIKDERNRSVTFLKRKHGLFKKAHELSVLCSADVAVIIFGSNKKLFEYSSRDLREMISRWSYHGPPHEHKGPADFNGGGDDDDEDDENGTPPQADGIEAHVFASHSLQGMQPQFSHIRHHTPSASPPIPNGVFAHAANGPRGHTPQPQMGSRPPSRNDIRRAGPAMVGQPVGPPGSQPPAVNGFAYMQQPAMYNAQNPANMPPPIPHGLPQQLPQQHPQFPYPQPQPQPHQMQPYVDEQRRASGPPAFPPQPQGPPAQRHSVSPPQPHAALPPQPVPHMSPPPPQPQQVHPMHSPPQHQQHLPPSPPPPPPPSQEPPIILVPPQDSHPAVPLEPEQKPRPPPVERARQTLLLDTNIKKQPQRKGGSIFTPIDEHKSVLMLHISAFHPEVKSEAASSSSRAQSLDAGNSSVALRAGGNVSLPQRPSPPQQPLIRRNGSLGSIPDARFTPPSRSSSMQLSAGTRPRLKVQIPDESDGGSATADSTSPRATATTSTSTDMTSQPSRGASGGRGVGGVLPAVDAQQHTSSNSNVVQLPPPSPSASALPTSDTLLSAGATGPPNPFARPLPQHGNNNNGGNNNGSNNASNRGGAGGENMNIDTPVSALPSRFLDNNFLPSPSSFYPEWGYRSGADSNTLPSPLNFATPVVGTGPSFLRDDPAHPHAGHPLKRKSPELNNNGGGAGAQGGNHGHHRLEPMEVGAGGGDVKRLRVE